MLVKDGQVRALLDAIEKTRDVELNCDEFLAHMGTLAEARAKGRQTPPDFDKVLEHERLCQNCREECEALLELLRAHP